MEINNVKISFLQNKQAGLFAIASFTINEIFLISGVGIHETRKGHGYRLTYPTKKSGDRVFNICRPMNRRLSKIIECRIFDELKNVMAQRKSNEKSRVV